MTRNLSHQSLRLNTKKFTLYLSILLSTLLLNSCWSGTSDTINESWSLYKIEYLDSVSGNWEVSEWMKNSTGSLNYGSDGMMSVEFIPENYGLDSTARKYAYTASYQYNPSSGLIDHTRLTHTDPNEIGKTVSRKLVVKGDTLIMYANEFGLRLRWITK